MKKITVIIVCMVLMINLSYASMTENTTLKSTVIYGNSVNNIANEGLVVGQGDWVYFSDYNTGGLYKMKTDGTNKKLLDKDTAYFLNIVADTIYYCNQTDANALYKIKTDGTEKKRLVQRYVSKMIVADNWIYFIDSAMNKFCKINLTNSKIIDIYSDKNLLRDLVIEGNWIYFGVTDIEASKLFKIKTDGTKKTLVYKYPDRRNLDFYSMCIENGWFYFLGSSINDIENIRIVKMKTDGTKLQYINVKEKLIAHINVYKGYIYYKSRPYQESAICRIRVDGKNYKMLKEIKYSSFINIYNDIIWGSYFNFLETSVKKVSYRINIDGSGFKQISKVPYPQVE